MRPPPSPPCGATPGMRTCLKHGRQAGCMENMEILLDTSLQADSENNRPTRN